MVGCVSLVFTTGLTRLEWTTKGCGRIYASTSTKEASRALGSRVMEAEMGENLNTSYRRLSIP